MLTHILLVICLTFNLAIKSADSQFYVDVDHSMPRFGKRTENNAAAEHVASDNKAMYDQQKELDEDRRLLNTFARTLKLIKLLDKNYENINARK